jgi:hypothetical protein
MASDHAVQNNSQTVKEPLRLTSSQQQQGDERELGRVLWVTVLDEIRFAKNKTKVSKTATEHIKEPGARESSFLKLPGEIRNMIYHHHLKSEEGVRRSRVKNRPTPPCCVQAGRAHLRCPAKIHSSALAIYELPNFGAQVSQVPLHQNTGREASRGQ